MKVKFIAEIGSNHNQDLGRTLALISTAKKSGCWGVKFQMFKAERLYGDKLKIETLKSSELPLEFLPEIAQACKEAHLYLGFSIFDLVSLSQVVKFADFLKIASFEILRHDLIKACAQTGKTVMLSTGAATYSEITQATDLIPKSQRIIFHCVPQYPANASICGLIRIKDFVSVFNSPIGWSDHTSNPLVIIQAINLGAKFIECHVDLDDMEGNESRLGHCWYFEKVKNSILTQQMIEDATKLKNIDYSDIRKLRNDPKTKLRRV